MADDFQDKAVEVRPGEEINTADFLEFLNSELKGFSGDISIKQFPGGYSNLTYLIKKGSHEFVLRKPPKGVSIKSAHDMGREFKVLSLLKPVYNNVPTPICLYEKEDLLGAPFYMMERVNGLILRNSIPSGLTISSASFQKLSNSTVDNLAMLHKIDIEKTGLVSLGKPDGYTERQVAGWIKRYYNAETDDISEMNETTEWMKDSIPTDITPAFIHNDFKYDNLVLDPETFAIRAILDWEMATVGNPLMDLGTTLGYWAEAGDHPALSSFGLTGHEGNFSRSEIADRYAETSGRTMDNLVFYYVFGCFKIAVIAQQIYARFKKGLTKDPRFGGLIFVTRACGENAANAIKYNRINNFR